MVEVFVTNVAEPTEAEKLLEVLQDHFPTCRINFDLEDCDRILRVEGVDVNTHLVMQLAQINGIHCAVLE